MKVVLDTDFERVWCDGSSPYVFCMINRMRGGNQTKWPEKQMELIHEVRKLFSEVYSIVDLSECTSISASEAANYTNFLLPQQLKAGVRMLALIKPMNPLAQGNLKDALRLMEGKRVCLFDKFEEALNAINRSRLFNLSKRVNKERALFSRLFPNFL